MADSHWYVIPHSTTLTFSSICSADNFYSGICSLPCNYTEISDGKAIYLQFSPQMAHFVILILFISGSPVIEQKTLGVSLDSNKCLRNYLFI